MCDIGTLI